MKRQTGKRPESKPCPALGSSNRTSWRAAAGGPAAVRRACGPPTQILCSLGHRASASVRPIHCRTNLRQRNICGSIQLQSQGTQAAHRHPCSAPVSDLPLSRRRAAPKAAPVAGHLAGSTGELSTGECPLSVCSTERCWKLKAGRQEYLIGHQRHCLRQPLLACCLPPLHSASPALPTLAEELPRAAHQAQLRHRQRALPLQQRRCGCLSNPAPLHLCQHGVPACNCCRRALL